MNRQVEKLERTVLELGTEIYRLRHALGQAAKHNRDITAKMDSIQCILDEKGIISKEDMQLQLKVQSEDERNRDTEEVTKEEKKSFH